MQSRNFNFGGSMKWNLAYRAVTFGLLISGISVSAASQQLPPNVTPAMLAQLRSMEPAQQQALAKQYGITLPTTSGASGVVNDLASPGDQLKAVGGEGQKTIKAAEPGKTDEVEKRARLRFGRDLFSRKVSTFAPTDDAPVPGSYRLGVGDQLIVQLFGRENEQLVLQIGRTGDVNFPKLGSINLAGLRFEDAKDLIKTRVEQQLIGVDVVVSMGRLRAINIFMAGEVSVPGAYSVSALTTVTQALFQVGGVTDIGSLRKIQVRRAGSIVATFDSYELLMAGDASNDIRLESGDVLFVPAYQGIIEVTGELKRPMIYELEGGETIGDVIAMAGSFTRDAYPALATLTRQSESLGLATVSTIDLTDDASRALVALHGDTLNVPKVGELVANSITLKGAATRPGVYGWSPGMRVSDLIGDARRDLDRNADLGLGMIVRLKNRLMDVEVISFDWASVTASPGTDDDPVLEEFDEVLVFSLVTSDLDDSDPASRSDASRTVLLAPVIEKLSSQARQGEPVQTVSVSGGVRAPGTYPLTEGATIQRLIDAAGGLKDSGYLESAELRRMLEGSNGEVIAEYREINLTSEIDAKNVALESRDHLTIRDIPDWSPTSSITIEGEVKFPGDYLIRRGERLSDVIARAGGFTKDAAPDAAIFTRESIAKVESDRAAQFAREIQTTFATRLLTEETTNQGIADVAQIVSALQQVEGAGRLLIDLAAAMSGDLNANLEVNDGDQLVIPTLSNTVSVVGEVKRQGTHSFQSELTLEDYIDLSAGLTRRADDGGIYIVRVNGSVATLERKLWKFTVTNQAIRPGDTIVIPINTQYKESLASWREITQVIYQSVVSIAAIARL